MGSKEKNRERDYNEDEINGKHHFKFKQSYKHKKMYRNLDNVLKKKDLKQLAEIDYDDYR